MRMDQDVNPDQRSWSLAPCTCRYALIRVSQPPAQPFRLLRKHLPAAHKNAERGIFLSPCLMAFRPAGCSYPVMPFRISGIFIMSGWMGFVIGGIGSGKQGSTTGSPP